VLPGWRPASSWIMTTSNETFAAYGVTFAEIQQLAANGATFLVAPFGLVPAANVNKPEGHLPALRAKVIRVGQAEDSASL